MQVSCEVGARCTGTRFFSTTSPVVSKIVCETALQFDITIESLVCRWLAMVASPSARTTPTVVGAHAPLYGYMGLSAPCPHPLVPSRNW